MNLFYDKNRYGISRRTENYVVKYYYVIIISLYVYSFLEYIKLHVTEF